jgi:hypothetical protein
VDIERYHELNELIPEGDYRAVISAVTDLGIVGGERRYRVTFDLVDCNPMREITKDYTKTELQALKRKLIGE